MASAGTIRRTVIGGAKFTPSKCLRFSPEPLTRRSTMKVPFTCVLALLSLCGLAFGDTKPTDQGKSEFAISGSYLHVKEQPSVWNLDGQVAFPVTSHGGLIF